MHTLDSSASGPSARVSDTAWRVKAGGFNDLPGCKGALDAYTPSTCGEPTMLPALGALGDPLPRAWERRGRSRVRDKMI